MILGTVSNCWRVQLQEKIPLQTLIGESLQQGLRAVELRQTCLGEFEKGDDCIPDTEALERLPEEFHDMQFNVAIAVPFLSAQITPSSTMFQAGLGAALAVAARFTPHLRLVDLNSDLESQEAPIDAAATALGNLTDAAADAGVTLSVENSIQPWTKFHKIINQNLSQRSDGNCIRLCYDPANLLQQTDPVNPRDVTRTLQAQHLSMVHFKQRTKGRFLDSVCDGDLNWQEQLLALAQIGFNGLALFEIESCQDIWQSMQASRRYLEAHGADFS